MLLTLVRPDISKYKGVIPNKLRSRILNLWMNFNSLKLWDYWSRGWKWNDNKITTGAEVGGLLPGLEFALGSNQPFKSSLTNQRLVIYLLLIFLHKGFKDLIVQFYCIKKSKRKKKRQILPSLVLKEKIVWITSLYQDAVYNHEIIIVKCRTGLFWAFLVWSQPHSSFQH